MNEKKHSFADASSWRLAGAIPLGTIVGATAIMTELLGIEWLEDDPLVDNVGDWFVSWAAAAVVFLIGLLTLGVPAWMLCDRLGRRNWYDAIALGFALSVAVALTVLPPCTDWRFVLPIRF